MFQVFTINILLETKTFKLKMLDGKTIIYTKISNFEKCQT